LSPPGDPCRRTGSGVRRGFSRWRTRCRGAGAPTVFRGAHRRAPRAGGSQGRQDTLAGVPAVAQSCAAALRRPQHRRRGPRADLRGELRGTRPRAARAGARLEPAPRGAGGGRAHAHPDRDRTGQAPLTADPSSQFRCGYAALVGRPNVGKSTLLNALVGHKLSIVTPRPQTTRHRILGVPTLPQAQIAFVDTPGLHAHASRALNKAMNRTASAALEAADVAVLVVEAS